MLSVRCFNILEELRNIGIVPETYEGLRIVAGDNYVVALVLTTELVVMLFVIDASTVSLDAHVAG